MSQVQSAARLVLGDRIKRPGKATESYVTQYSGYLSPYHVFFHPQTDHCARDLRQRNPLACGTGSSSLYNSTRGLCAGYSPVAGNTWRSNGTQPGFYGVQRSGRREYKLQHPSVWNGRARNRKRSYADSPASLPRRLPGRLLGPATRTHLQRDAVVQHLRRDDEFSYLNSTIGTSSTYQATAPVSRPPDSISQGHRAPAEMSRSTRPPTPASVLRFSALSGTTTRPIMSTIRLLRDRQQHSRWDRSHHHPGSRLSASWRRSALATGWQGNCTSPPPYGDYAEMYDAQDNAASTHPQRAWVSDFEEPNSQSLVPQIRSFWGNTCTPRGFIVKAEATTMDYGQQGATVNITSIAGPTVTFPAPHGISTVYPAVSRLTIAGSSNSYFNGNQLISSCPTATTCNIALYTPSVGTGIANSSPGTITFQNGQSFTQVKWLRRTAASPVLEAARATIPRKFSCKPGRLSRLPARPVADAAQLIMQIRPLRFGCRDFQSLDQFPDPAIQELIHCQPLMV